jgi:hypothetical protein
MITRKRAIEILADHGFTVDDEQPYSFDEEVGPKPEYKLMEILGWLGYCCPSC